MWPNLAVVPAPALADDLRVNSIAKPLQGIEVRQVTIVLSPIVSGPLRRGNSGPLTDRAPSLYFCISRKFVRLTSVKYAQLLVRSALRSVAPSTAVIVGLILASPAPAQGALDQDVPHHPFFDTDANTGGYAGVALGKSDLDIDAGELAHSSSLVTQGRPFSFELAGGYRPMPLWSGELTYLRLGQASAGKNYTQTDGFMLSALVYLPTP